MSAKWVPVSSRNDTSFTVSCSRHCFSLLLSLSLLLLWQGCAIFSKSHRPDPNADPRAVYLRVAENYRHLQSFRGKGRLIIDSPEVKLSAPATVLTLKPDSLFIQVEAVFGIDVGFFFADGKRFESYSPLENTYFFGGVDRMQDLMLFQFEATYEEIMSSVVGTVLPPFDSTFTMHIEGDSYRFDGRRLDWQVAYWVDPKHGVVTKSEQRDSTGALYARQSFRRFRKVRGVWLPQLIRMEKPAQHERLTMFYSRIETNVELAASDFSLRVPASAKRVHISPSRGDDEVLSREKQGMTK